ncbi:MAG: TetR/AcrR family transcriptional regulator [Pseudomonadales bacterium]|nr:TetR/AcrR family transcriptional regulator [Pseudomonadales bacterium]
MSETEYPALSEIKATQVNVTDGRRLRSRDSKRKIVSAMLELVREGRVAPTADEVAQRANVGLRTVFRRFKDMESLYAEMSVAISEKVAPIIDERLEHDEWWKNFAQLVERRIRMYEIIMPYRIAANALKFQSTILHARHREMVRDERERLVAALPEFILQDSVLAEALEAALSFDMWNQLRNDQKLSVTKAGDVVYRLVGQLLPEAKLTRTKESPGGAIDGYPDI